MEAGDHGLDPTGFGEISLGWRERWCGTAAVIAVLCVLALTQSAWAAAGVLTGALALSGLSLMLLHRLFGPEHTTAAHYVTLLMEGVLATLLLAILGGLSGPFVGVYALLALIGGLVKGPRCAATVGVACLAFYGVALWIREAGLIEPFALGTLDATPWASSALQTVAVVTAGAWAAGSFGVLVRGSHAQHLEHQIRARTVALETANQKLRELQEDLLAAQSLSAGEDLAGSVAHSINNPLAALIGTVEMMIEHGEAPPDSLERVLGLAHRIKRVSARTLELFRRGALQLEEIAPEAILSSVVDELQARARESGVEIGVETCADLPLVVVDRTLLVSALIAIAENSFEAVGPQGRIWLAAEADEGAGVVRFRIEDDGPGIPGELHERVLEPFFTTKGGGTGLGLAIARGVIQGHRGSLRVEDRPGGGAAIVVVLPADFVPAGSGGVGERGA